MTHASRATRLGACALLFTAFLYGCDGTHPAEVQDASLSIGRHSQGQVVHDNVPLSVKRAGRMASGSSGATPSSSHEYTVSSIPFAPPAGPPANLGPVCDDCVMNNVPIGFSFEFYGNAYSTLQISSNGFLRFSPANNDSGCCSGRPIPQNDDWNNIIAFGWTDLVPDGDAGGRLRYETRGSAPNRQFILHADGVRYFGGTGPNLIQWVVLYEGSNNIEIHTQLMTPRVITQGIENADGTVAHFLEGRVATNFSLSNDGVRFSPGQQPPAWINVDIDAVYSGPPNRTPNQINLDDQWVYVEILDVEQYLGRPASASDVRMSTEPGVPSSMSWETGVPAQSFTVLDINGDGDMDIRLRWSTQALVNAGVLEPNTARVVVWGRDPGDNQLYRGLASVTIIGAPPPPPPACSVNNGGIVTHPNGGTGAIAGQNVSMAAVNPDGTSTAGSNVRHVPPDPHFRVADDFTVGAGGCVMNQVVTHAYRTGGAPNWTGANINIRSGSVTGPVVATATTTSWAFTGIYRTFNGVLNNADRPVYRVVFDFANTTLPAGTYWLDWQVTDGTSGWAPYVMQPDPQGGSNTSTVYDNGRHLTTDGWVPLLNPPGAETPFLVRGPGAPPLSAHGEPAGTRPLSLPRSYNTQRNDVLQ
jgi:hypothetical protein